jgi:hypothetical protein
LIVGRRPVWVYPSVVGLLWATWDPLLGLGHGRDRPHRRATDSDRTLPRGRRRKQGHKEEGQRQVQGIRTSSQHQVGPLTRVVRCEVCPSTQHGLTLGLVHSDTPRTAYEDLAEQFPALILDDQECFKTPDQYEALLHLVPDQGEFSLRTTSAVLSVWPRTDAVVCILLDAWQTLLLVFGPIGPTRRRLRPVSGGRICTRRSRSWRPRWTGRRTHQSSSQSHQSIDSSRRRCRTSSSSTRTRDWMPRSRSTAIICSRAPLSFTQGQVSRRTRASLIAASK